VFGHFYSIDLAPGEQIDCRSVLEIVATQDKPADTNLLLERAADAIFIMMNPGSPIPLEEVNNRFSDKQVGNIDASLVKTRPDTTQYLTPEPKTFVPIVCAWGVSPALDPLIERCLAKLTGIPGRMGLLKPETEDRYFHPLPTLQKAKIQWVDNMVRLINL